MHVCRHFPDGTWGTCSICNEGAITPERFKACDRWQVPATGLVVDDGDVLIESLMAEAVCPACLTQRSPIGCKCSRDRMFTIHLRDAEAFLQDAPDEAVSLEVKWSETESQHVAASVFKRISRRVEWESDDERAHARRGFLLQQGTDPLDAKWFPVRITEETHLPI